MIYLLLCAILITQAVTIVVLISIQNHLDDMNDFSKEDKEVKKSTKDIKQARNRLPHQ